MYITPSILSCVNLFWINKVMIIRLFIEELCKTKTLALVRITMVTVGQKNQNIDER